MSDMKQESVTLDYRSYRPLRSGERYCPACGADTLRREPDGTVYYVGHSEANCYKRQLSQALAEADRWRKQYEALRAAVEGVVERIDAAEDGEHHSSLVDYSQYHAGREDAFERTGEWLREVLAEHGGDDGEGSID